MKINNNNNAHKILGNTIDTTRVYKYTNTYYESNTQNN
jgi:hypothetical protein